MADDSTDRVKLGAWVSKGFRLEVKKFCLRHGDIDMQDVIRELLRKLLAEDSQSEASPFVQEILARVRARPADVDGKVAGKLIAMARRQSGSRLKKQRRPDST